MLGSSGSTGWGLEEHGQFLVWQVGKLCKRFTFGTDNAHHHTLRAKKHLPGVKIV